MHAGKLIIIAMFAAGLGAASAAWWHRLKQTDDALAYWTPTGVAAISQGLVTVVVQPFEGTATERDLTGTRGLPNVRHTLLQDMTFAEPVRLQPLYHPAAFTLRFVHDAHTLDIHFSETCDQLWKNDDHRGLALNPQAADYFRNYFAETLAEKTTAPQPHEL